MRYARRSVASSGIFERLECPFVSNVIALEASSFEDALASTWGSFRPLFTGDTETGPRQTTRRPGVMSALGWNKERSRTKPARVRFRLHYGKLYSERRFDLLFAIFTYGVPRSSGTKITRRRIERVVSNTASVSSEIRSNRIEFFTFYVQPTD